MAVTKAKSSKVKTKKEDVSDSPMVDKGVAMPKWHMEDGEVMADGLDPKEEKMLDWILKGVVGFILGWLGLSIILVIGGYFNLWG